MVRASTGRRFFPLRRSLIQRAQNLLPPHGWPASVAHLRFRLRAVQASVCRCSARDRSVLLTISLSVQECLGNMKRSRLRPGSRRCAIKGQTFLGLVSETLWILPSQGCTLWRSGVLSSPRSPTGPRESEFRIRARRKQMRYYKRRMTAARKGKLETGRCCRSRGRYLLPSSAFKSRPLQSAPRRGRRCGSEFRKSPNRDADEPGENRIHARGVSIYGSFPFWKG